MSKNVEVVRENERVAEVARRLADSGVGSMPICDGDRLQGTITDRDIVTKVVARGKDPRQVTPKSSKRVPQSRRRADGQEACGWGAASLTRRRVMPCGRISIS